MIPGVVASGLFFGVPTFRSASSTSTIRYIIGQNGLGFILPTPTGAVAGDLLIVQMFISADSKAWSTGDAPEGWTQQGIGDESNYPYFPWRTYSRVATGSDSFVWTGGNNWFTVRAAMIAVSGATAIDAVGPGGESAQTAIAPSVTTTTQPTLLVGLFAAREIAIEAPASMTSRINVNGLIIATEDLADAGATGTRTCPTSSSNVRYSQLIAIR